MSSTHTSYGFAEAKASAEAHVAEYPLTTQVHEARVFMHLILNYFRELGVSEEDRLAIMHACSDARFAEWRAGYESAKNLYRH